MGERQIGHRSRVKSFTRAFRSSIDVPVLLLNQPFVSLRNRTAERRGRQNAWVWQTWRGYYLLVLSRIHSTSLFLARLQKDLFKGMWSLAEGFFNENYCHGCHTRFALVFPLPSCCVSSLLGTLWSDNGNVHENVAEKLTSHPFKPFSDYPKSHS